MSAHPHSGPVAVPSLDQIADDPKLAITLPREAVLALHARAVCALAALEAPLLARVNTGPESQSEDRLLDVDEAAAKLRTSKDWLYRRSRKLPFAVRLGVGRVRFSSQGIDRWIRDRQA